MKIHELNIKGFRSLKEATWKPGDLNVLIGPNASGKSNLLRFLEFISASAEGKLSDYVKRAGGMEPLVWDGKADAISYSLESSSLDKSRESERNLTYQLEISKLGFSNHKVNYELLGNFYKYKQGLAPEPFKFIERNASFAVIFDENEKKLTPPANSYKEEESILSLATGLFLTNHLISLYRQELLKWYIYHDIHVNQNAEIRRPAVAKYEKTVNPDGQNLIPVLHTLYTGDRDFKKAVDAAMSTAFGDEYEELIFPPAADQRIHMRIRWKSLRREQSTADLSDGTLRFLMLLAILASPSPGSLIAIDEPETGLHPSMLPIIAEYAVEASKKTQVILTTHSPQFLNAFQDTKPTTTVTKWEEGQTMLKVLGGEQLDYWLREYSLGELYETNELENMAYDME